MQIPELKLATLTLPATLPAFMNVQAIKIEEVTDYLESEWVTRVIAIVDRLLPMPTLAKPATTDEQHGKDLLAALMDQGPGLDVDSPAAHVSQDTALRFIKMLAVAMSDQLRSCVLGSIEAYLGFWQRYDWLPGTPESKAGYPDGEVPRDLQQPPPHKPPADPDVPELAPELSANTLYRAQHAVTRWGGDLFAAHPPPLFLLQLVVRPGQILLEPSLQEVLAAVEESYNSIIRCTHNVDDIAIKVFDVSAMGRLPSVSLNEPVAEAGRSAILTVVEKNVKGPAALLASFQRDFNQLVQTDTQKYVEEWAAAGHTLEETEAEIQRMAKVFGCAAGGKQSSKPCMCLSHHVVLLAITSPSSYRTCPHPMHESCLASAPHTPLCLFCSTKHLCLV